MSNNFINMKVGCWRAKKVGNKKDKNNAVKSVRGANTLYKQWVTVFCFVGIEKNKPQNMNFC